MHELFVLFVCEALPFLMLIQCYCTTDWPGMGALFIIMIRRQGLGQLTWLSNSILFVTQKRNRYVFLVKLFSRLFTPVKCLPQYTGSGHTPAIGSF